jgi:hypothetical protein
MFNNSKINSWSDTQIQVEVFTDVIAGYPYSPGSWSNTVAFANSSGGMDSFYALTVPFGYGQAKWTTPPVPYYINPVGGPSESETVLQAAANTWNGAGANFSFNYGGPTSSGWGLDGQNVLSFADLGSSSIIAQATTYYTGGIVSESDIQFNTGFTWSTDTPTPGDKMDLQSIGVHELGHWLRLLDLYGTNDATKVMYGFASYGTMKRNLTSGDQAGIQWIYPPTCIATVSSDRWKGEYFNNQTLSGSPSMVRDDGTGFIDFNWGYDSPSSACAIGTDHFSVRWTKTLNFDADTYRFTVTGDDGVRLYIDGTLKLDKWFDQGSTTYTVDVPLTAGTHTLKLEYYENAGGAVAKLSWQKVSSPCIASVPSDHWKGEYFNNQTLSGSPSMVRDDGTGSLNFDWGLGSPSTSCAIGVDNFSVRWTRTVSFNAGAYRFTVTSDDGFKLYVDDQLALNKWFDQPPTTYTVDVSLTEGNHTVKMEYYENGGGALAKLSWELVSGGCISSVPSDHWKGEYFNNQTLSGSPSMVRDDGASFIDFDWGTGSPSSACGIGADNFSVRWTRTFSFDADTYRFTVTGDDGFRLYVDDVLKLEKWFDQPPTTYSVDVPLSAGNHTLKMEYYEHGGGATAKLSWQPT